MVIARIPDSPTAIERTLHAAHAAEQAGWQDVTTGWDIQHQAYTVNAEPADDR